MSKAKQLEQLEQECKERGVKLIYDDLRSEGGLCRLRGSYYVILNRRLASETKTRIIVDALARVRDAIENRPAVSDRVPNVPEAGVLTPVTDATEAASVIVGCPVSVYEEPALSDRGRLGQFGVPVAAGVPDSRS